MAAEHQGDDRALYPRDTDRGVVEGRAQEHILVLGDRSEINLGVSSNASSVAAHLAYEHRRATGNGACWLVLPVPEGFVRNAVATVEKNYDLIEGTDLLVVMIGTTDTLHSQPSDEWAAELDATLTSIDEVLPAGSRVVVAEIPALEATSMLSRFSVREVRRRLLNRRLRAVVGRRARVTVSRLSGQRHPDRGLTGPAAQADTAHYERRYAQWAREIKGSTAA